MIRSFTGDHRFLSNFFRAAFYGWFGGYIFQFDTNEHWYQANKATNWEDFIYVLEAETPGEARRRGNEITARSDWEDVKVDVMYSGLVAKFSYPALAGWLAATGDEPLVEGNPWGDRFWGVSGGVGQNVLGVLLMELRRA